ncbi:hypothetical protein [Streptomyces sp. NPDC002962]|uniref:hypothetical protein n=1 Tax=Streptomyces sp. NPDC002962 TaxID=3364674 RepID=UPI003699E04A
MNWTLNALLSLVAGSVGSVVFKCPLPSAWAKPPRPHEEHKRQRHVWFEVAHAAQTAVTRYPLSRGLNRFEVEQTVRGAAREEPGVGTSAG